MPSGRGETVAVSHSGTTADLKIAARQSLGQPFLRLAAPDRRLLDPANSLRLSELQDRDTLAAVAQQPKIATTGESFTLWCDGSDGALQGVRATAPESKISSVRFSRFAAHSLLLLR